MKIDDNCGTDQWIFEEERIIICEGVHDQYFLESLIKERNLPAFQVKHSAGWNQKNVGGIDGFPLALESLIAVKGFRNLRGIAIVTDNDHERSLERVKSKLSKHFKKFSDEDYRFRMTDADHIVSIRGKPTLIILVPDNAVYGNLETLCLQALYDRWPTAEKCVHQFLECTGASSWSKKHQLDKAKVRSIISAHYEDEPYIGLGQLFQKSKALSASHSCFDQLADVLSRFDEMIQNCSVI